MWSMIRRSARKLSILGGWSKPPTITRVARIKTQTSSSGGGGRISAAADPDPDTMDMETFKAGLDGEARRRLDTYVAEYEIFKYADSRMPARIEVKHWRRMLAGMESKTERIQFLSYLYQVERAEAKDEVHKQRARERAEHVVPQRRREIEQQKEQHIYYGIGGSCIFRRIMESDMNKRANWRLALAMVHGPHLVFDMSFYPIMKPIERSETSNQLLGVHRDNRAHRFPHHILFTGCNREDQSWKDVRRYWSAGDGIDGSLYTVTDQHYTQLFPKERLVYLSPDARQSLVEYDPDKVYIVGAMVDRMPRPNLTLARAKEEGIEARRLPFERCMRLIGAKSLCLNHIVSIMNDAHAYGSITAAMLKHMPKRKVVPKKSEAPKLKRQFLKERLMYLKSLGPTAPS